nr:YerC/YecD family TrpR-related protein [Paenibacillus lautus]
MKILYPLGYNGSASVIHTVTIGDDHPVQLKKLNDKSIDQLFEAILTLDSVEECYVFFDDLCTVNEIQSLSQRLEVARMLGKGCTYNQIEAETGASTATISRVKRCLNYGNDGYKMTLERLGR